MPRIAHRRRGSKFGHPSFRFALVKPPLLPLALSTSSFYRLLALIPRLRFALTRPFHSSGVWTSTAGDTTVPRRRLLSSFLYIPAASMLTPGPLLCL
jgi:hypothetical protein